MDKLKYAKFKVFLLLEKAEENFDKVGSELVKTTEILLSTYRFEAIEEFQNKMKRVEKP